MELLPRKGEISKDARLLSSLLFLVLLYLSEHYLTGFLFLCLAAYNATLSVFNLSFSEFATRLGGKEPEPEKPTGEWMDLEDPLSLRNEIVELAKDKFPQVASPHVSITKSRLDRWNVLLDLRNPSLPMVRVTDFPTQIGAIRAVRDAVRDMEKCDE